uniref:Uncharacterized protein n=1 Tax=viral metagenome TaxID=1070528 RepID=A0A6M3KNN5_9ZZZZ
MSLTDRQIDLYSGLTNKQFRAKYKVNPEFPKYKKQSKKQRQNWWKGLSPKDQESYISALQEKKRLKRQKKHQQIMKRSNLSFDCSKCIHGTTESCTDQPKDGCIYFFDAINNVFGPAYRKQAKTA